MQWEAHLVATMFAWPKGQLQYLLKDFTEPFHFLITDWDVEIAAVVDVLNQILPWQKDTNPFGSYSYLKVLSTIVVDWHSDPFYPLELPLIQVTSAAIEQQNMQPCYERPFLTSVELIGKYFYSLNLKTSYLRSYRLIER